ncbi:hypothetical protein SprV_0902754500 [Sparganum proliferum]
MFFHSSARLSIVVFFLVCYVVKGTFYGVPCKHNRRVMRRSDQGTMFSASLKNPVQFLKVDRELFAVGYNNCTSLTTGRRLDCKTFKRHEFFSINISLPQDQSLDSISLHTIKSRTFDETTLHGIPKSLESAGTFFIDSSTVLDICTHNSSALLNWKIRGNQTNTTQLECSKNAEVICTSKLGSISPCNVTSLGNYTEINILAVQMDAQMDNYVCTHGETQSMSKSISWMSLPALTYSDQVGYDHDFQVLPLVDDGQVHNDEFLIEEFLEELNNNTPVVRAYDTLYGNFVEEIPDIRYRNAFCDWKLITEERTLAIFHATCRRVDLSNNITEVQSFSNLLTDSYRVTEPFLYHSFDTSTSNRSAILYWIVDANYENLTKIRCNDMDGELCSGIGVKGSEDECETHFVGEVAVFVLRVTSYNADSDYFYCSFDDTFTQGKNVYWKKA